MVKMTDVAKAHVFFLRKRPMQIEQLLRQHLDTINPIHNMIHREQMRESIELFLKESVCRNTMELDHHSIDTYRETLLAVCTRRDVTEHMKNLRSFLRYAARKGKVRIDPECIIIGDGGYGEVSVQKTFKPYMLKTRFKDGRRTDLKKLRDFYYYRCVKGMKYKDIMVKMNTNLRQLVRYRQYLDIAGKDKLIGRI